MKIKKSQQESVSLFDKIAGQLAMMLSTKTHVFYFTLTRRITHHRATTNRDSSMALGGADQRQLPRSILPHVPHRTQGG